jgi:hypothetical protein
VRNWHFPKLLEVIMTLVEKAVQILVKHGFNAVQGKNNSSFIIVKFPDTKIVLHHFDVYDFLNRHHKQAV